MEIQQASVVWQLYSWISNAYEGLFDAVSIEQYLESTATNNIVSAAIYK